MAPYGIANFPTDERRNSRHRRLTRVESESLLLPRKKESGSQEYLLHGVRDLRVIRSMRLPTTFLEPEAIAAFSDEARRAVYEAIALRRDVRHFRAEEDVDAETLERILEGAHQAPSVGFSQPWGFILVRDRAVRERIRRSFLACREAEAQRFPAARRDAYLAHKLEGILEAALNICVAVDLRDQGEAILGTTVQPEAVRASACCAVENLWLAARAEGIGVGWVSIVEPAVLRAELSAAGGRRTGGVPLRGASRRLSRATHARRDALASSPAARRCRASAGSLGGTRSHERRERPSSRRAGQRIVAERSRAKAELSPPYDNALRAAAREQFETSHQAGRKLGAARRARGLVRGRAWSGPHPSCTAGDAGALRRRSRRGSRRGERLRFASHGGDDRQRHGRRRGDQRDGATSRRPHRAR